MRFTLEYPLTSDADGGAWNVPANIAEFARVAEASGVDGLAFTDHPAPSRKWLDGGGHETLDPFVALGFCAAATSTLHLMTNLTVVPYRNPLLMARSMTSVDVLSGGRAIFVLGTGYLRSEFAALGVDFDERNGLFDEAVEVLQGIWSSDDFSYDGRHFKAIGQVLKPGPVQRPYPPLWVGGNSKLARERVARWGNGWAPMVGGGPVLARTTRTAQITSDEHLGELIADLGARLEANGRSLADVDICSASVEHRYSPDDPAAFVDGLAQLAEIGVTWTAVPIGHRSFAGALDTLRRFGDDVIRERPLNVQSVYADNAGVRIHALDNGARDTALPPVVVVPGMGESADEFAWIRDALGERRVVVIDVRGRGRSDAPEHGYRWEDHISDLAAMISELRLDRPILVAFSRGSSYALGYALSAPGNVRGVVVGDYWARHVGLPPEFADRQLEVVLRGVPMRERMPEHAVIGVARESREVPLWDRLVELRCPVLVIRAGRKSALVGDAAAAQWTAALPTVELVLMPEAGHDLWSRDPDAYLAVLRPFLESIP